MNPFLIVDGQTAKVAISVQPSNATINAYDIKPDNESFATMDQDGTIKGLQEQIKNGKNKATEERDDDKMDPKIRRI